MNRRTRSLRRLPNRWAAVVVAFFPSAVWAATDLPVGIVPEHTLLSTLLRIAGVAWGTYLLVLGNRKPAATLMTFYLGLGLAVGFLTVGRISYLAALIAAAASTAVAVLLVVWLRRVAAAIACVWILPAVYAVLLFYSGSFERSAILALSLAVAGSALGAAWPKGGIALLAAALGTVLVMVGLPALATQWSVLGLAAISLIWQLVIYDRLWRSPFADIPSWPAQERRKPLQFAAVVKKSLVVTIGAVLAVMVLAPQYGPGDGDANGRMSELAVSGRLTRPTVVLSKGDNLYLSGHANPIAIVAPEPGLMSRLVLPITGRSASPAIRKMRAVKDPGELEKMRRAAAITSQTFSRIAPMIRRGVNEKEIADAIVADYGDRGATGVAFDSIVGSGKNATLPHYGKNNATMTDGLVVIDIGCSVDGYASDMTRTFPVSGRFSPREQELVDTVNAAGDAARALLRSGVTMRELDSAARKVIEDAGYGPYFLHGLGHHVGLDVHDPHAATLETGMVITIEPGIYISEGSDIDPAYWNLGVRIEDSYIVTADGYEEITSFPR